MGAAWLDSVRMESFDCRAMKLKCTHRFVSYLRSQILFAPSLLHLKAPRTLQAPGPRRKSLILRPDSCFLANNRRVLRLAVQSVP
jgi:hypothetical protein